ncbi:hypothetical protein PY365_13045 [Roseiarcaceae bacterium H3SJ34-1]|uniref:Bug family tripartite tricarboxylate transporter substrate binding protein n=1 Tax=Terripilifer ovatus TaxID=3032367 RepID=UPI003AB927FA|nr:hypothetical protein [Roseiarcaceae bacterium H3SJ34-1]
MGMKAGSRSYQIVAAIGLAILPALLPTVAAAQTPTDFYKGKTITVTIGFPPGGGYDTNARILARHMGRYIPGQPSLVPANMPGAGSLVAANFTYNLAPADGTVFTIFAPSTAMEPIFNNKAARFEAAKFGWLGSMAQEVSYCGIWQGPGVATSWDEAMKKETIFGGGATSAITYQHPMVLKNVLGANLKVIPGYPGTRDINLAMQRGEVHGSCGLFESSIASQWHNEVESGKLKLVIQMGAKTTDRYGKVPSVFDYARTEEQKQILDIHFGQLLLSRPFAAPPKVPADRLDALRKAFMETMKDKEFLADAAKAGLEIDPVTGEEVQALLAKFANYPPEVLRKADEAMGR